jgi:RecA-family ATPase/DNA-binding MarR family transcriptional regulator
MAIKFRFGSHEARSTSHPDLPLVVANFLDHGAEEGMRNHTLHQVAIQVRDMGASEDQCVNLLSGKATEIGLGPQEIATTIKSAYRGARREPPSKPGTSGSRGLDAIGRIVSGSGSKAAPMRLTQDGVKGESNYVLTDEPLPEALVNPTVEYLKAMFRAGERIQIVRAELGEDGKEHPCGRTTLQAIVPLEGWLAKLSKKDGDCLKTIYPASSHHGAYVCVNPLTGSKRAKSEIAKFRHALIEFDNIPRHHQWQLIQQSKLPCTAVVDSGGKSIHALVKIEADNLEEYEVRVQMIMEHFAEYGVDTQNCDPSRLSRLPGARREDTGEFQRLLSLGMGSASFEEWQNHAIADHELPPEYTVEELEAFKPDEDPGSMLGKRWLCRGGTLLLQGQSGIGKSSFLMQMAITFALGKPFFGVTPIKPLSALIIQAENDMGDLAEAYQGICHGMELTGEERAKLRTQLHFHRDTIHTGEKFVHMATRLIAKHKPDLVFADPLLSFIGGDISDQETASTFLRNQLGPLLLQSQVMWVWLHHTGKPPADKSSRDNWNEKDMAYMGLGSSELANWAREVAVLQKLDKELDLYGFTLCKRGGRSGMVDEAGLPTNTIHLQHAKGRICWERADLGDMDMIRAAAEEEAGRKGRGRPATALSPKKRDKILDWVRGHAGESVQKTLVAAAAIMKCSEATAKKHLNQIAEDGLVEVTGGEVKGTSKHVSLTLAGIRLLTETEPEAESSEAEPEPVEQPVELSVEPSVEQPVDDGGGMELVSAEVVEKVLDGGDEPF